MLLVHPRPRPKSILLPDRATVRCRPPYLPAHTRSLLPLLVLNSPGAENFHARTAGTVSPMTASKKQHSREKPCAPAFFAAAATASSSLRPSVIPGTNGDADTTDSQSRFVAIPSPPRFDRSGRGARAPPIAPASAGIVVTVISICNEDRAAIFSAHRYRAQSIRFGDIEILRPRGFANFSDTRASPRVPAQRVDKDRSPSQSRCDTAFRRRPLRRIGILARNIMRQQRRGILLHIDLFLELGPVQLHVFVV